MEDNWFRAVPLGGLGRIGGNMMVYETATDLVVVDCGVHFPGPDEPGVSWILPNVRYIAERKHKLRGYLITHAHEDHVGALPYILPELPAPVYGTRFTLAVAQRKLDERGQTAELCELHDGKAVQLGEITVEPLPVTHSIPSAVALAFSVSTPAGVRHLIHTGDFKIDPDPLDGRHMALDRMEALGQEGVFALFSDSTNAEKEGHTWSEREVAEALTPLIAQAPLRVLVTTFASNVHRLQSVITASAACNRKVAVVGRSAVQFIEIALRLGMLKVPHATLIPVEAVAETPRDRITIIASGCQAEEYSSFGRIAAGSHGLVSLSAGDRVIISARKIPGNERAVGRAVNKLLERGIDVIDDRSGFKVHTSGHAFAGEQAEVIRRCNPQYFVPLHGEMRHMQAHAALATQLGALPYVLESGSPIRFRFTHNEIHVQLEEAVEAGDVYLDGLEGVEDIVLRDRRSLAEGGFVVCALPLDEHGRRRGPAQISTRGVFWVDQNPHLMDLAAAAAEEAFDRLALDATEDERWEAVRLALRRFFRQELERRPMILPSFVRVD